MHSKSMHEWGGGTQPKDSFCHKLGTGCFSPVVYQLQKFHQLHVPFSINTEVSKVRFANAHPRDARGGYTILGFCCQIGLGNVG